MQTNRPDIWKEILLGNVLTLEYGKALDEEERVPDGKYPAYGANGIKCRCNKYLSDTPSIIIGRKGSAGEINYSENKFWVLDVAYYVKFDKSKLDIRFLFYLLKNKNLPSLAKGVKPGINRNDVYSIKVKIPPLSEQERIVQILDEVFENIEKAKQNTLQNLNNAKELFESSLKNICYKSNDNWKIDRADSFFVLQRGYDLPVQDRKKGEYPLISSNGISDYINQYKIKAPAVVTGRSGTIGKVHYVNNDFWPLNTSLYIKDFKGNLPKFIYYFLQAMDLQKFSSGTGVPTLNRNYVHEVKISIPSVEEQQKIVVKLDELQEQTKKLEQTYNQKLKSLEELKQSILQKAFNGEL